MVWPCRKHYSKGSYKVRSYRWVIYVNCGKLWNKNITQQTEKKITEHIYNDMNCLHAAQKSYFAFPILTDFWLYRIMWVQCGIYQHFLNSQAFEFRKCWYIPHCTHILRYKGYNVLLSQKSALVCSHFQTHLWIVVTTDQSQKGDEIMQWANQDRI